MRTTTVRVALLAALALAPGMALAADPNFGSAEVQRNFRFDYRVGPDRSGRPVVWGYVYNDYGSAAGRVRMLVEEVDGQGRAVGQSRAWLPGTIPGKQRAYFEVPVTNLAGTYRVTLESFQWEQGTGRND
ncbi:MAG: hypothetical protein HY294_01630 [Candidatus Rokubacteria bacterium]|nr:hypothetical protein [Candidatus Rokubacteria bacterium]